ncbi:MAG: sodium:alanine symporter family protein [Elusimicrobia bacterium]|nr:sodium:alanine symporter family protein [Elusimicrobiota bacterium]
MLVTLESFFSAAVEVAWGWPLIALLIGGGAFLTVRSGFLPFRGLRHTWDVLRGKFDDPKDPGQISHFQALTTAVSSTVGMGNIAGVAVAITQGGPGAVFWMWVTAIVGMTTKFFECTLASLYRKVDDSGQAQGGPMYTIELGLGRRYRFLGVFFSVCGLVGCLSLFQSNQIAQVFEDTYALPRWLTGTACMGVVSLVILGGIARIGKVTSRLVPFMCAVYVLACLYILVDHYTLVPGILSRIFREAFTGTAALGGLSGIAVRTAIITGIKRAAFSNEAGIGTSPMAHAAAKTQEPIRQGLVAMWEPFIDTVIICSLTALTILTTPHWQAGSVRGVALTYEVFEASMGAMGRLVIVLTAALFAVSTMIGYSYYGKKCFAYLFGWKRSRLYDYLYIASIFLGATWSVEAVVNVLDTSFALMALPNMIATLALSGAVMQATRDYFRRHQI